METMERIFRPFEQFLQYHAVYHFEKLPDILDAKILICDHLNSMPDKFRTEEATRLLGYFDYLQKTLEDITTGRRADIWNSYPLLSRADTTGTDLQRDFQARAYALRIVGDDLLQAVSGALDYIRELTESFFVSYNLEQVRRFVQDTAIEDFQKNEIRLLRRKYIDTKCKWDFTRRGNITAFLSYSMLLEHYDYFTKGKEIKQFLKDRYGNARSRVPLPTISKAHEVMGDIVIKGLYC
jgi:hypothetical protein